MYGAEGWWVGNPCESASSVKYQRRYLWGVTSPAVETPWCQWNARHLSTSQIGQDTLRMPDGADEGPFFECGWDREEGGGVLPRFRHLALGLPQTKASEADNIVNVPPLRNCLPSWRVFIMSKGGIKVAAPSVKLFKKQNCTHVMLLLVFVCNV